MHHVQRQCPECTNTFRGRIDKKFCSDQCRTSFHNRVNSTEKNYVRRISHILLRNRRILSELSAEGRKRVMAEQLINRGFNFKFFTSLCTGKEGKQYFYCYEHGYRQAGKEIYVLVNKKDLQA